MQMTFEAYDGLCSEYSRILNPRPEYVPDAETIDRLFAMETREEPVVGYLIWVSETAEPEGDDARDNLKAVNRALREHLTLMDEEEVMEPCSES